MDSHPPSKPIGPVDPIYPISPVDPASPTSPAAPVSPTSPDDPPDIEWKNFWEDACSRLSLAGAEVPEIDARRIIESAAGTMPSEFHKTLGERPTTRAVAHFKQMLARRCAGEPLQYVVGSWGFRSLDLMVDRRVLIPRPETEVVAGWAITEARKRCGQNSTSERSGGASGVEGISGVEGTSGVGRASGSEGVGGADEAGRTGRADCCRANEKRAHEKRAHEKRAHEKRCGREREVVVVDLGTGSGAIALAVAQECPQARVYATDISTDALAVARANLAGLGRAATRVTLHAGDWYDALPVALKGSVDVLVSNPPYVGSREPLPKVVADWEPPLALIAGHSGDEHLTRIVDEARRWLHPDGVMVLELAPLQAKRITSRASKADFEVRVEPDLSGRPRVLVAHPAY